MILKCAQRISLSEHSHPPKLIKSYIAISCLIKATLCSENPAQLSNGCYSMKTDCIFLLEEREKNRKQHILSLMACRGLSRPRCAKMERFPSHASMGIFAPAGSLVNQWRRGRSNRRARPGSLRHLNWQRRGWLCPNHRLCFSSSMASSWTLELHTIDTRHIFQPPTCYWSLWLQTLLSCWCGCSLAAWRDKHDRSQRKQQRFFSSPPTWNMKTFSKHKVGVWREYFQLITTWNGSFLKSLKSFEDVFVLIDYK